MNRHSLLAVATLGLTACTTYRDDVETICDLPDRIGSTEGMRPNEKIQKMGEYAEQHVKSKEGRDFLLKLAQSGRGARNKLLRVQALKLNINPCHLADEP